jgi:hypothetical protein
MDDIIRALSEELLQASMTGRAATLNPQEAHGLASALLTNFLTMHSHLPHDLPSSVLAFHLGIGHRFGLAAPNPVTIVVNAHHNPANTQTGSGIPNSNTGTRFTVSFEYNQSCHFSVQITLGNQGHAAADNSTEALEDAGTAELDFDDDDIERHVTESTWRQRYMKLRTQMQKKEHALSQYKRKIVESVMADI